MVLSKIVRLGVWLVIRKGLERSTGWRKAKTCALEIGRMLVAHVVADQRLERYNLWRSTILYRT
eukprot:scaffold14974_cov195-Amphora_coffeaeformis.AAC.35